MMSQKTHGWDAVVPSGNLQAVHGRWYVCGHGYK